MTADSGSAATNPQFAPRRFLEAVSGEPEWREPSRWAPKRSHALLPVLVDGHHPSRADARSSRRMLHRVSCPTGGARPRQADPRSVTADVNQVNGPNSPGIQLIGRNAPKTPNTRIRRRKPQQRAPGHVQPPSRTRPVTCWPNSTGSPSSSRGSSRRSNVALSHPAGRRRGCATSTALPLSIPEEVRIDAEGPRRSRRDARRRNAGGDDVTI